MGDLLNDIDGDLLRRSRGRLLQRIDDSFTNTTDLPDGEEWVFEVMTTEDAEDIDDYDIVVTDDAF